MYLTWYAIQRFDIPRIRAKKKMENLYGKKLSVILYMIPFFNFKKEKNITNLSNLRKTTTSTVFFFIIHLLSAGMKQLKKI